MEYRSRLADIGIVLKAKNCLVFQGQIETIASMTPKERCTILDEFSGYVLLQMLLLTLQILPD